MGIAVVACRDVAVERGMGSRGLRYRVDTAYHAVARASEAACVYD
jgi:hypothetical protein